jgi:hypothetical protein
MSYRIRWAVEMLTAAVRGRADSHSQERADEARATAGYVSDLDVKATMFRIANKYDRLARLDKERLENHPI